GSTASHGAPSRARDRAWLSDPAPPSCPEQPAITTLRARGGSPVVADGPLGGGDGGVAGVHSDRVWLDAVPGSAGRCGPVGGYSRRRAEIRGRRHEYSDHGTG